MPDYILYIDDTFRPSSQNCVIEVINPATEEVFATVACATNEDVNEAVAAAKRAQPVWAKLPAIERGRALRALASSFREHTEELAGVLMREQGKVRSLCFIRGIGLSPFP